MSKNLLIELGCEELPPKALKAFSDSFSQSIRASLESTGLTFSRLQPFATPRRLAVTVFDLADKQADQVIEKLGPAVSAAFDDAGNPTKAALGFARSNSVDINDLLHKETDKGIRLMYSAVNKGSLTIDLIGGFIEQAIKTLPIPKRMKWGAHRHEFSRPVHWITCVYKDQVVDLDVLGLKSADLSYGHRFHAPEAFTANAENYQSCLLDRYVIADYSERQTSILKQLEEKAQSLDATLNIDQALLDEVTSLVEWPVALVGQFDTEFLKIPQEVLISSMKEHQKYFHLSDSRGALLPYFITIANIESSNPELVINGNERVIRPRLADAAFFFETDKKQPLVDRCSQLQKITFQTKLGSVFDKTQRLAKLSVFIAEKMGADTQLTERAAVLCKSDLITDMVCEFPDLQGVMGFYYATNDGEDSKVCDAISEHYQPKSAEDALPASPIGQALALADRIDTLVGIFAIGQQPSGNKDPFALRRSSLGILKIIIEKALDLDLLELFNKSAELYDPILPDTDITHALNYTVDRLKSYYNAQGIRTEVYLAVADKGITQPLDFDRRINAVQAFDQREESLSLAAANKRVNNLLSKNARTVDKSVNINNALLQDEAEKQLVTAIETIDDNYRQALSAHNYTAVLDLLAGLKNPVDNFFDKVMIMVDDEPVKQNRLIILYQLSLLFSSVANISLLSKS